MSIKIKTLKRFLLISMCLAFASINYFNYVKADNPTTSTTDDSTSGLTDTVSNDFQAFLASKNGQTLTLAELKDFASKEASTHIGTQNVFSSFDSLPKVDPSEIKVLSQKYASLSESDRALKIKSDDDAFLGKITYVIVSNLPKPILSVNDLLSVKDEFYTNLVNLSSSDNASSLAYFKNLGDKMDLVLSQTKDMEVPENLVGMYTKALRIAKGLSTIKEDSKNFDDPVTQVIMLKKITNLTTLTTDFVANDVSPFMKNYFVSEKK